MPKDVLIPEAFADLSSNPTITLLLGEAQGDARDYPDGRLYQGGIDIDNKATRLGEVVGYQWGAQGYQN